MRRIIILLTTLQFIICQTNTVKIDGDTLKAQEINECTILGEKDNGLFQFSPGTINIISEKTLLQVQPFTMNELFRKIPGINVVDEEGVGLRMNIGIRGMDPDRSRGAHILEDGIPIALGPYGENELYYTPLVDRMSSVEVLKGSGQILYGPQTVGGVVNFLTASTPNKFLLKVKATGGTGLSFLGSVTVGNGNSKGGWYINYTRKQGENVGVLWYRINDVLAKFAYQFSSKSHLTFKANFYNELSNSTYVGLTQGMYDNGQYFERLAPDDRMNVNRYSASLVHDFKIKNNLNMITTIFGSRAAREWRRQEFSSTIGSNFSGQMWGDSTISGGAIFMQNTTGMRYRYFDVAGIENKFSWKFATGSVKHKLEAGLRFIYEHAVEDFTRGATPTSEEGTPISYEFRNGYGLAPYLQNKIFINSKLTATVGVRGEFFWYDRNFRMLNSKDTVLGNQNFLATIIPGVGLNYQPTHFLTLFTGFHRGFAPPRVKDAINTLGQALVIDAENSWNTELGLRLKLKNYLSAEVTGYYTYFTNQVVPISISSGNSSSTGLSNAGSTNHAGVEAMLSYDLGNHLNWKKVHLILDAGFTYQVGMYASDRYVTINSTQVNLRNNRLPYAPNLLLNTAISLQTTFGLDARINFNYIGSQFSDDKNTVAASNDGRIGEIPAYFTLDASASYQIPKIKTKVIFSVKNMTDNRYIISRRPQGIKVGLPLFITGGLVFEL